MKTFIKYLHDSFDETSLEDLTPNKKISEIPEWDSITILTVIDIADRHYSKNIDGSDIEKCTTLKELYNMIKNK